MTTEEDARELAALALAETIDAIEVLSRGCSGEKQTTVWRLGGAC